MSSHNHSFSLFLLFFIVVPGIIVAQTERPPEDAKYAKLRSTPSPEASEQDVRDRNVVAYPDWRLHKDWMYQDFGIPDEVRNFTGWRLEPGYKPPSPDLFEMDKKCFCDSESNEVEARMVRKVLDELKRRNLPSDEYEETLTEFLETKKPGSDPAWKELYFKLCELRRKARLSAALAGKPKQYVYAKHFVFGDSQAMFMMTTHQTDADYRERGPDYKMGSELCLMTITDDGNVMTEILYDCPAGVIRDPCVSFDGKRIVFSMRHNDLDDDFHLFVMNVEDRSVKQITFGDGVGDMEPCYLPNGDLIFESTRPAQCAPCWWSNVTNLYTCDGEGRYIRRLAYDHAHTCYPSVLPDGRISYTRWEYNDRHAAGLQPAMIMNADGTNQTELYGNNSLIPTALTHLRGIPGTQKVVGIMIGHHNPQHGKLMLVDRTKGTQENQGLKYICPAKPMRKPDVSVYESTVQGGNTFGCFGELFQYPWPLDETNYLVSFLPEPPNKSQLYHPRGPYPNKFGIYWMGSDGERELLIYDPTISSGQVFPLATREAPPMRPTQVDQDNPFGTFYVQDVHHGPAMAGVKHGTVKKLRVVGLDGRAAGTTQVILHPQGGRSTSALAINNGSYDVKHVLGTVDVEDDGSVMFDVPARTPVYFQLLDEKGYTVQTMRSWTLLQPGETLACVGCHEDKNTSFIGSTLATKASRRTSQKLKPFFKEGEQPVQEQYEFFTEKERRAWDYLGVNAPQDEDVPRGFSYRREIQPIWDAHCIQCHAGTKNPDKADVPMSLLGDSGIYDVNVLVEKVVWKDVPRKLTTEQTQDFQTPNLGRDLSESYLALTQYGFKNDLVNFPYARGVPQMIPSYNEGSANSRLMSYLEPSHYGVRVSREEKERVACWIDLLVPYCGSWLEANTWDACRNHHWQRNNDQLRGVYLYNERKRLEAAMIEVEHLDRYKEHLATGKVFSPEDFPRMTFGGWAAQKKFLADFNTENDRLPINGIASGLDSRGGTTVAGNPVRNLALNPHATTHKIRSYPHASSNSHHKYRAEYSPKNLIDGNVSQDSDCWKPDPRTDLWVKVEFGREVSIEKTILHLKLFHDATKTWTSATLVFSGGEQVPIKIRHTGEPQEFSFPATKTTFVTLADLKDSFPLGENGIIQWEFYGKDIE